MPRLTDNVRAALPDWWSLAVGAAEQRLGSAGLVQAAAYVMESLGGSLTFAQSSALPTLYSYAVRLRNAGEAARAASNDTFIGPEHVAIPPWAREENDMNASPIWHVTYSFTYEKNGAVSTEFKTSIFERGQIPDTIGELKDALQGDANQLANKYAVNLISADLHQILAV